MTRYNVTVQTTEIRTVDAPNPYQAALNAALRRGEQILDVVVARGRPRKAAVAVAPPKKRRPMSPEGRAALAQNLVKARAARAKKAKARKAATRKALNRNPVR